MVMLFFFFFFLKTGFLCVALAALGTHSVDQAVLNSEIQLLLPPECWDYRCLPPPPLGLLYR